MNCLIAGAEVARLLLIGEHEKAREYAARLTSGFTSEDVEYVLTRIYAVAAKEGGVE